MSPEIVSTWLKLTGKKRSREFLHSLGQERPYAAISQISGERTLTRLLEEPKELCEIGVAARSVGNFNSCSIAWKRGSMRNGSMSGSVF
jgi:hypothetical protein